MRNEKINGYVNFILLRLTDGNLTYYILHFQNVASFFEEKLDGTFVVVYIETRHFVPGKRKYFKGLSHCVIDRNGRTFDNDGRSGNFRFRFTLFSLGMTDSSAAQNECHPRKKEYFLYHCLFSLVLYRANVAFPNEKNKKYCAKSDIFFVLHLNCEIFFC